MPQTHLSQGIYIPKKFLHGSEGELYRDICCSVYGRSMLGDGYLNAVNVKCCAGRSKIYTAIWVHHRRLMLREKSKKQNRKIAYIICVN